MDLTFPLLAFAVLGIKGTIAAVPVITPEGCEYIVKAKEDLKLTCKGDANITWSYSEVLEQLKGNIPNIDVRISQENDLYVAELTITSVNGMIAGFYFCNETGNPENFASLYLYVDDDEIFYAKQFEKVTVNAELFQPVIIPCTPTHPSVRVVLYARYDTDGGKKMDIIKTGTKDSEWTYDPVIGFRLGNVTQYLPPVHACAFHRKGHRVKDHKLPGEMQVVESNEFPVNNITIMRCNERREHTFWKFNLSLTADTHFKWIDSRGNQTQKYYNAKPRKWESIFIIRSVPTKKHGDYISEERSLGRNSLVFTYDKKDKPRVRIIKSRFHIVNATEIVKCFVRGNPTPKIKWEFKRCIDDSCEYKPLISSETTDNITSTSSVVIKSDQSGYIKCFAENLYGWDTQISDYTVTDVKEGFQLFVTEDNTGIPSGVRKLQLATGSRVRIDCLATLQNYSSSINWYINDRPLHEPKDIVLRTSQTQFSMNSSLIIHKMSTDLAGLYTCYAETIPGRKQESLGALTEVVEPQKPHIILSNMDTSYEKIYPSTNNFTCFYEAVPRATIKWYKDGLEFFPDNTRVKLENMEQVLLFIKPNNATDEGDYTCGVTNRLGSVSKTATLKFTSTPRGSNTLIYVGVGILPILLIAIVIPLIYKIRKERQMKNILKQAGLANFEQGAIECINPNLGIDDQAQLLPYNKESWEIPREKIKLGKQLGAGAFGVVMEAAIERYDNNTDLKVAVKMIKRNAEDIYLIALLSELKIMAHLGKHLNVLNLIGASTKHVVQRELYVIVEFCQFGNLRNYLLHHRENFINQIDPGTEKINYSIGADVLSRSYSVASDDSQTGPPIGIDDDKTNSLYVTETAVPISSSRDRGNKPLVNNISIPLKGRSNSNVKPICTKDLLTWAFQVSRGMEYLASRRVLHGDLASRNILLATNNIVKIADFGLAKRMYKSDDYKKKRRGPLPIKWMSIESMRDNVFSTQSDVWSFGVVLWEFFSLARTPYPGMAADERILEKLVAGYRMDQPTYATKEIYSIMLNCWETEPLSRPTFQILSDTIGSMLEESVTQFYIKLNEPYQAMNKERIRRGQNDYLQMVSPPDFKVLSSPNRPHHTLNVTQYNSELKQPPVQFF